MTAPNPLSPVAPVSGAGSTQIKELYGYRVDSRLGVGARSVVYAVTDARTNQRYALKRIIRNDADDDPFIEQARGEYEVGRKLKHPNLRRCVELFVQKKLMLFGVKEIGLLMELVEGIALVDRRTYPPTALLEVFRQTAEGLAHMHRLGYVHADMKPHNIIVSPRSLAVKIVDYGQSCPIGMVKERIQGTPDYIAPEQVYKGPIEPRTDVYNLGATMYWAFTGRTLPSALDALRGAAAAAAMLTQRNGTLATPAQVNSRVTAELDALIMACCRQDRKERPSDMPTVLKRLEGILDDYRQREPLTDRLLSSSGSVDLKGAGSGTAGSGVGAAGSSELGQLGPVDLDQDSDEGNIDDLEKLDRLPDVRGSKTSASGRTGRTSSGQPSPAIDLGLHDSHDGLPLPNRPAKPGPGNPP